MDDEIRMDGNVVNGSWSTCAPHVRLDTIRYIRYRPEARLIAKVAAFAMLAAITMFAVGGYLISYALLPLTFLGVVCAFLGIICVLVTIIALWALRRVLHAMRLCFQNALLTPGIVVSNHPLEYACLANLQIGPGDGIYGVKRLDLECLPSHPETIGTRFPCVSTFKEGDRSDIWADFSPQPLSFGIGDIEILNSRTTKIGEESFVKLESLIQEGLIPMKAGELLIIDS